MSGIVLGFFPRIPARGDEKRTVFGGGFDTWLVLELELGQEEGCAVWEVVVVPAGVLFPVSSVSLWACWLSPSPVFSVFLPFPRSIGSSGADDSGTYGMSAEESMAGLEGGEERKGVSGRVGCESGA